MKRIVEILVLLLFFCSCSKIDSSTEENQEPISNPRQYLASLGFDITRGYFELEEAYIVEYDIYIRKSDLQALKTRKNGMYYIDSSPKNSNLKLEGKNRGLKDPLGHYYEDLIWTSTSKRIINIYLSPTVINSLNDSTAQIAIDRYNALNLKLKFALVSNASNADIIVNDRPTSPFLMSAGFPYWGDPYDEILVNTNYNFNDRDDGASVFAHEIGHCIGFRHTDYMDRSFSCLGSPRSEYTPLGGHIAGTPIGPSNYSWMLACTNGNDRPFTAEDITALTTLYGDLVYVKRTRHLEYDYSYYTYCCEYVDKAYSIKLEFFSNSDLSTTYTTSSSFEILAYVHSATTHLPPTLKTYNVPIGSDTFILPDLDLEKYDFELGTQFNDESQTVSVINKPYFYTLNY